MLSKLSLLGLAAFMASGVATVSLAAGSDAPNGSQRTTETQTGSQMVGRPATGSAVNTPNGQNTTNTPSPTYTYPKSGTAPTPGMSAQSSGQPYPSVVGPTGSTQSDATNPNRTAPQGGNNAGGASGAGR
jgi:hypothetical protein